MDDPRAGRIRLENKFSKLALNIPADRNRLMVVFLSALLVFWSVSEYFIICIGFFSHSNISVLGFILFTLWTCCGLICFIAVIWHVTGKSKFVIGQGKLTIVRKSFLYYSSRSYQLSEVRRFSATGDPIRSDKNSGGILFSCNDKWHTVALGMDVTDVRYVIEKLRENNILSQSNFNS